MIDFLVAAVDFVAFVAAMTAYAVAIILLPMFRILGEKSQAFQAVAHLVVVGGMFGAWIAGAPRVYTLYPALLLSLVELGCFIADRTGGRK